MKSNGRHLSCCYPSKLENIDDFCSRAKAMLAEAGLSDHGFPMELLIREAMTNAMVHGNGLHEEKKVHVSLKMKGALLFIRVYDEGQGFDWSPCCACADDLLKESGRGLRIYERYASRFGFNRRGNGVVLSRRITRRYNDG
jgi:serine/threonine-protein kinase RsbW